MAVLDRLRDFWSLFRYDERSGDSTVPAVAPQPPESINAFARSYQIHPLTPAHLDELWQLDRRCFVDGEAYTRATLEYLLNEPNNLSFRIVQPGSGAMVGFIITMLEEDGTGHVTTIGVAPEHRRRGLAYRLLGRAEDAYRRRRINLIRLEVRTVNAGAQELYKRAGYTVVQRLTRYYANGGDGLLMVKPLD